MFFKILKKREHFTSFNLENVLPFSISIHFNTERKSQRNWNVMMLIIHVLTNFIISFESYLTHVEAVLLIDRWLSSKNPLVVSINTSLCASYYSRLRRKCQSRTRSKIYIKKSKKFFWILFMIFSSLPPLTLSHQF
jgi:hypothetical protein